MSGGSRSSLKNAAQLTQIQLFSPSGAAPRLICLRGPPPHPTTYTYDAARNQTSLTDARGSRYTFTYDALRRKTSMTYPDGSVEKWAYDLVGNQVAFTNRAGQTKATAYTAANQPLTETWSAAASPFAPALTPALPATTTYAYNADGRLKQVDNGTTKLSYTYDDLGRLTSETSDLSALVPGLASHTVGYRYDALGRRSDLVYPDKTKVSYDYDARSRLTTIDPQGGGRTPLATYAYDAQGRIDKLTRDNGVASTYTYDMAGQLTDITHANGGTVLARSAYTLDVLGRRTAQTREDGITETYGYDTTSQLTSADYGTNSRVTVDPTGARVTRETFAYDALGNRTSASVVGGVPSPRVSTYTANALNQYTQVAGVAFAYDANGNLTNDGKQTYRYDAQNRMLAVEPVAPATGAVRAEFAYDARNRAVARTYYTLSKAGAWVFNPDDSRALTYDTAWNLLAERTRNGAQVGEYIHGQRTDEVLRAEVKPSNLSLTNYYPLADGLGSVVSLVDSNGKVTERYRYSVIGAPTILTFDYKIKTQSLSNYRNLYTGREWLGSVGLNEHRSRYYSVNIARWINTDPIRFNSGEKNLYNYCSNSPVNSNDPTGLASFPMPDGWEGFDCNGLASLIRDLVGHVRDRYNDLRRDQNNLYTNCPTGPNSWAGHVQQQQQSQQQLRGVLNKSNSNGCGGDGIPANAWGWATIKAPSQPDSLSAFQQWSLSVSDTSIQNAQIAANGLIIIGLIGLAAGGCAALVVTEGGEISTVALAACVP